FGSCMFFLGALLRQLLSSSLKRPGKIISVIAFTYLFLSTATLGGGDFLDCRLLRPLTYEIDVSFPNCLILGSVLLLPLFVLGIVSNGSRYEKKDVKAMAKLIIIMTMTFMISTYFNCTIIRPCYRSVLTEGGTGFTPWYHLSGTGKLFMSLQDLISPHEGSFICGHAMYAVLFLIIIPSFTMVFRGLKGKEKILTALALVFTVPIILSRLISGDNYLTDIALGGISAVKICFSFSVLDKKNRKTFFRKIRDRLRKA
ncbi:MAG: phosphatase PAP2 family protein, partial [Clostridiales bacterium]|nr:phosphatase PAP2 family protein [Clostridiales bacterium]